MSQQEIDLTLSDDEDHAPSPAKSATLIKGEQTPPIGTPVTSHQTIQRDGAVATNFANHLAAESPGNLKRTRVDGKGMWNSWTRNFKTHTLALLDLIDNSLDASIQAPGEASDNFIGRVHIHPDIYEQEERPQKSTTGITIINNSWKPIRPLAQVLEVYNSSKLNSASGDIGENGVGLKQGCAAISDLSFILVKNGSDERCELGFVAETLQRVESVYLPAFEFSNNKNAATPLSQQMLELFSQPQHQDVADCVAQYGAALHGSNPSLATGINRLCLHFDKICHKFYENPYVFSVILDKPRENIEERCGAAANALIKIRVNKLLKTLRNEIPLTYLRVPESFDFRIEGQDHQFNLHFWQSRLVELSEISVNICKTIGWHDNLESEYVHPDSYNLKIFLGFDRVRVTDSLAKKAASLYIYSRQSGRLVKYEADARHLLGLGVGGSTYSSGLTILVDDIEGNLPLNPTKQDLAFGEDSNGETHSENLYKMIGAAAKWFYDHVLSLYAGKKEELTKSISQFGDKNSPQFKSLDESQFTSYSLAFRKHGKEGIRVDKKHCTQTDGCDTIWRLDGKTEEATAPKTRPKRRTSPSKSDTLARGKPAELKAVYPKTPPPRKRSRPNYYEGDDVAAEEELEEESDEEQPRARTSPNKARGNRKKTGSDNVQYDPPGSITAENGQQVISLCDSSDEEEEEEIPTTSQTTSSNVKKEEIGASEDMEIIEVKKENAKLKKENDEVKKEKEQEIDMLKQQLETLNHTLSAKDRTMEKLRIENEGLKKQLEHLRMGCSTQDF